jgi:hypothetical protein
VVSKPGHHRCLVLFLQCQTVWWKPAPLSVGWHVRLIARQTVVMMLRRMKIVLFGHYKIRH